MEMKSILLGGSIVTTGLVSGLLYGWTVSVIPGTRRLPDRGYIDAMQNINRAIVNPAFIIPFMGIPVMLAGAAVLQFRAGNERRGWLLAGAAGTYVMGVLGITIGGNIPLNDALDTFDLAGSTLDEVEARRQSYETPWNRWHYARTIMSIASFSLAYAAAAGSED